MARGKNVGGSAIYLNTGYGANTPHLPPTNRTGTPIFRDLLFEDCDFVLGDLGYASAFSGLKEAPATNITFRNVNFYPPGKNPAWPKPRPAPGLDGWSLPVYSSLSGNISFQIWCFRTPEN